MPHIVRAGPKVRHLAAARVIQPDSEPRAVSRKRLVAVRARFRSQAVPEVSSGIASSGPGSSTCR
jgi:hypothetical protein